MHASIASPAAGWTLAYIAKHTPLVCTCWPDCFLKAMRYFTEASIVWEIYMTHLASLL